MSNAAGTIAADVGAPKQRVASYVRMSSDKQDCSVDLQRAKIEEYVSSRAWLVVREYADDGKSGLLGVKGRPGLSRLMADVLSGAADFSVVIVYDVSRWGRFQDADEAAFYEYTCRRAGIDIAYCAEHFSNDGSPMSSLFKGVKRIMAAEYSRELSSKVFAAQCRLAQMGYKQGGPAGYGLRRLSVSADGIPRRILNRGELKPAATDRVVLILGPADEVAIVRRIYSLYIDAHLTDAGIAGLLNSEGIESQPGCAWSKHHVVTLLTNLKYVGTLVFNRKTCKLSARCEHNPSFKWIVQEAAYEPLVSPQLFKAAQDERRRRRAAVPQMLEMLRSYFRAHGKINERLIDEDRTMPHSSTFVRRFGSLSNAYRLAGISKSADCKFAITRHVVQSIRAELFAESCRLADSLCLLLHIDPLNFVFTTSSDVRIRVQTAACRKSEAPFWMITAYAEADFLLIARLDCNNRTALDYLVIPTHSLPSGHIYLRPTWPLPSGILQFRSLDEAFGCPVRET